MGGRGTFAAGNNVKFKYKTVGTIDGVKIIAPIDPTKALKLPEESHSSIGYVLYDKDGVFHQYREYNDKHEIIMEIGYHHENRLGKGDVLHVHIHTEPGIDGHKSANTKVLTSNDPIYQKYKKLFKGVKI